jgi:hypothetical protein
MEPGIGDTDDLFSVREAQKVLQIYTCFAVGLIDSANSTCCPDGPG